MDLNGSSAQLDLQLLCQRVYQATRTDPKRSVELARAALALARASGRDEDLGLAARSLGHAWRASAEYRRALSAYAASDRAFERAGKPVERARNAIGKLDALMYLGRYEQAIAEAASAEAVFLQSGEDVPLATLRVNLGSLYFRLDRYAEAAQVYSGSLPVFEALGDLDKLANARFNLATVKTSLLRFDEAAGLYEQAAAYFRTAGMRVLEATTEFNMACLEHMQGHYSAALQKLDRAIAMLAEAGDPGLLASCWLEQADLYLSLGMPREAGRAAARGARSFAELRMNYEQARSLAAQGVALALAGQIGRSLEVLAGALELFRVEGNERWIGLTRLHVAEVHRRAGRKEQAARLAWVALRALQGTAEPRALALAQLVYGSCDPPRARMHLGAAVRRLRRAGAAGLEAEALARLARVLDRQGPSRGAQRCLKLAIERAESLRARLTFGGLRRHFRSGHSDLYARLALLRFEQGGPSAEREALQWLERGRARSLIEILEDRDFRGFAPLPTEVEQAQTWPRLREELNLLYRALDARGWAGKQAAELEPLRERIRAAEQELAEAELLLGSRMRRAGPSQAPHHVALKGAASTPGDEILALEYFEVDGVFGALAWRDGAAYLFPRLAEVSEIVALLSQIELGHAGAVAEASLRRRGAAPEPLGSLEMELRRLYELLLHPAAMQLGLPSHLLMMPAGVLWYVPFSALQDQDGQVLVQRASLSLSPSLGALARFEALVSRPKPRGPALVVGYGANLPGVDRELDAIESLLRPPVHRLRAGEATVAAFRELAPTARLLHLACHGVYRRDHPMFSSVVLADGRLSFYDLFRMELQASLVVLSACETGRSEEAPGEELMGLAGGFLSAGVRSVVVCLWEVIDEWSFRFMDRFYRALVRGQCVSEALGTAMIEVRAEQPHPAYWAPYVLIGDPKAKAT